MRVERFADPAAFLAAADDFLDAERVGTSVLSTVTTRVVEHGTGPTDLWLCVRARHDRVIGAAMVEGRWNLFLSPMAADAATCIADRLAADAVTLPGVSGERHAAAAFVERWTTSGEVTAACLLRERAYVLERLVRPVAAAGSARRATVDDLDVLSDWLAAFHVEANPRDPFTDATTEAVARLADGPIWLWTIDDRPVSMVAARRPVRRTTNLGPVYTPPSDRRRGWAAAATSAAIRDAQRAGAQTVMLYADTANPASNALYRRLGFRPDHHLDQYSFSDRAT